MTRSANVGHAAGVGAPARVAVSAVKQQHQHQYEREGDPSKWWKIPAPVPMGADVRQHGRQDAVNSLACQMMAGMNFALQPFDPLDSPAASKTPLMASAQPATSRTTTTGGTPPLAGAGPVKSRS